MNKEFLQNGFTLIEVLVSLAIFATMALAISQLTGNVFTNKAQIENRAASYHALDVGIAKLFDDLNMAFLADSSFQGKETNYKTGFKGEKTSVNFSTMSHIHYVKNQRDSDQVVVGYALRQNSKTESNDLFRRETDHLMPDIEKGGQAFLMIPQIKTLEFSYYDANQKEWKEEWDTNSIAYSGALPSLVKINLTVFTKPYDEEEQDRKTADYEILVPIELYNQKISFQ